MPGFTGARATTRWIRVIALASPDAGTAFKLLLLVGMQGLPAVGCPQAGLRVTTARGENMQHATRMTAFVSAVTALVMMAFTGVSWSQSAEPVGYVLRLEGNWTIGGSRPLKLGQALHREDLISGIVASSPVDRLTIVAGGTPHSCVQRCPPNIGSGAGEARTRSFADSMLKSAMSIFQEKPDFPATVSIRGRVSDGVVSSDNGRLDFSQVLKECRAERIDLRLRTVAETPTRTIEPVTVPCEQGRPMQTLARGAEPGLYQLDLLQRSSDGYIARGVSAWVLVAPVARATSDQAAFSDAQALTRSWEPAVDAETIVALQRAYLEHLALQARSRP